MPESLNKIPEVTLSRPLASAILAVFISAASSCCRSAPVPIRANRAWRADSAIL